MSKQEPRGTSEKKYPKGSVAVRYAELTPLGKRILHAIDKALKEIAKEKVTA